MQLYNTQHAYNLLQNTRYTHDTIYESLESLLMRALAFDAQDDLVKTQTIDLIKLSVLIFGNDQESPGFNPPLTECNFVDKSSALERLFLGVLMVFHTYMLMNQATMAGLWVPNNSIISPVQNSESILIVDTCV